MITDFILNALMLPIFGLMSMLPSVDVEIPINVFKPLYDVFAIIGKVLPVKGLMPILVISMAVNGFRIAWAIILRIKSFIPTMGD